MGSLRQKIKVELDDCYPGTIIAETIYNDYGAVIVWEDTALTENVILKLRDLGVKGVLIFKEDCTQEQEQHKDFRENYEKDIQSFKQVLFDVSIGKNIKLEQVDKISESVHSRINQNSSIIDSINQVRSVDEYTYHHCINVSMICMLIGKWMDLNANDIQLLVSAGILHDIGKGKISPAILNKPDKLTKIEFEEVKKHCEYGYLMLKDMNVDKAVLDAVLTHHEREDGSGYPLGLTGGELGLFAKIIAVADIFDAMTANRTYKHKDTPFDVFNLMQNGSFGYLDPKVIEVFLKNMSHYYIGKFVMLNDGRSGEIVYFDTRNISWPLIKVDDEYIDLVQKQEIKIVELI